MLRDASICRSIVRRHARTFWLASRFLPAAKQRAIFAVYAFCREADDLIDASGLSGEAAAEALAGFRARLDEALHGRPEGAVFRELALAVREFGIPGAVLHELLDGVARDLEPLIIDSWPALARYCEGVASTVAEMCTHVFGVDGGAESRPHALRYARTLGIAMQVTNILRDVGEDARRGRCYLPEDELAQFGLSRERVLDDPTLSDDERWRPFMALQIGRARSLYEAAIPGIAMLDADTRRCALACARGYAGILGAIERIGYDSIRHRARLTTSERIGVFARAWLGTPPHLPVARGPHLPERRWPGAPEREAGVLRWT
jgi:phytoene synthase